MTTLEWTVVTACVLFVAGMTLYGAHALGKHSQHPRIMELEAEVQGLINWIWDDGDEGIRMLAELRVL